MSRSPLHAAFGSLLPPSIPVLCYHDISNAPGSLTPARFREHLDALQSEGWQTITAQQLWEAVTGARPVPRRSLVLTFDDGHISNALLAAPELERRGMTGVFFAVTDFITPGPARSLEAMPPEKPMPDCFIQAITDHNYEYFINEGEIKILVDAGHEVHAHGCKHQGCFRSLQPRNSLGSKGSHWASWSIYPQPRPGLPTFEVGSAYVYNGFWPDNALPEPRFTRRSTEDRLAFCRRDFARSLERMRELNHAPQQFFCWPWGNFDVAADQELRAAGFHGAFTLERGPNARGTDPFRLHRIGVASSKRGDWLLSRLRMYGSTPAARVFFKKLRKRPELRHALLVTDSVKISGGSRQLINNAVALERLGMQVSVCIPTASPLAEELPQGVRVARFDHFRRPLRTARFLRDLCRGNPEASPERPPVDVVHTFHNKAYKPAILARLAAWAGALCGRGPTFRLFINRGVIFKANSLFGLWARLASGMVVNSLACAESLRRLGVPRARLNVVHNALDAAHWPLQDREAQKKRGVRVLYLGNEAPAKGLDVFLEACAEYVRQYHGRDLEFVVAGTDKLHKACPNLPPEVEKRLHCAGPLPHRQVLDLLDHSDLLVISSRQESMPNVLLEAFHSGLPVVGTRVGGIPELVRHRVNGLLCESEDAVCLAGKIRYLVEHREERLRMGQLNQSLAQEHFTPRAKGLKLLRVYHGQRVRDALRLPEAD
jgi:glycosyltransferase involved in cell wall biosynthesis/peptidoglycan/xylan/chitin deacetylase (PgdA/CDA1 family)